MAIKAAQVKALRDETGLPMMECKAALSETNGDAEEAKVLLQKKYKGKMEKRSGNETGEGAVAVHISDDKKTGSIIDVRCETAPVAKTDQYVAMADAIAKTVCLSDAASPSLDEVLAMDSVSNPGRTLQGEIEEVFGLLRENIKLTACTKITTGYVCSYVHHDCKTGVLVGLDAAPTDDSIGTDLCHHVTFSNPMAIAPDGIPAEDVEKVRSLSKEIAEGDGKPPNIVEMIVEGKVNAFYAEKALIEQEHVKVPKTKVKDVLKAGGVNAVTHMIYCKIG